MGYKICFSIDIQRRLQQEIDDILDGADVPTYNDVAKMEYLDAAIHEIVRMHPPLPFLQVGFF